MDSPPQGYAVFRRSEAIVAESLVSLGGAMLWCDITAGLIHRSTPGDPTDGSRDETFAVAPPVGSFHPAASGFVVSLGDRVVTVGERGGVRRTLAIIEHAHPRMRLNEGKVDPAGRWITGSMELINGDPIGAFYSVTDAGELRTVVGGIGVANGLEWSLDGSRIFYTDTSVGTIFTGSYSEDGEIGDIDVFHRGVPHDGLVIDLDGNFWCGIFGEGRVLHLDGHGVEIFSIPIPAPNLTSVAFHGNTLYVASAREKLTDEQLEEHPLSGSVFAIETTSSAMPARIFGG